MIEHYQPRIDEIQENLARDDISKREKILWVFKISKLSDKILADFEKQVGYDLRWPQVKNQVVSSLTLLPTTLSLMIA